MLDAAVASRGATRDIEGVHVRALRARLGLSLMDFGSEIGKDKATIYRWEQTGVDEITWLGILAKLKTTAPTPSEVATARKSKTKPRAH